MRRVRSKSFGFGCLLAASVLAGGIGSLDSMASAAPPERLASYVVVLRPDVADVGQAARGLAAAHGGDLGFVYEHALRGFSVTVPPEGAAGIAHNPHVAYVEPDQLFTLSAQT